MEGLVAFERAVLAGFVEGLAFEGAVTLGVEVPLAGGAQAQTTPMLLSSTLSTPLASRHAVMFAEPAMVGFMPGPAYPAPGGRADADAAAATAATAGGFTAAEVLQITRLTASSYRSREPWLVRCRRKRPHESTTPLPALPHALSTCRHCPAGSWEGRHAAMPEILKKPAGQGVQAYTPPPVEKEFAGQGRHWPDAVGGAAVCVAYAFAPGGMKTKVPLAEVEGKLLLEEVVVAREVSSAVGEEGRLEGLRALK